ncbi:MAG: hypothetical protein QQN55_01120 [Nitrosopumilus sp.]
MDQDTFLKAKLVSDNLFFTRYFFKHQYGRKFVVGEHHKLIAEKLDKVLRGEITRLIINIAPRYGKTEQVVKGLIAQGLAINSKAKFIHASYSDSLALDNSEVIKELIESEEYQRLFNRQLKRDSKSKKKWYTQDKGGVYATSTGGQITGFGAGLVEDEDEYESLDEFIPVNSQEGDLFKFGGAIVIDDPIKPEDAKSMTVRAKVNERFDSTIRSRVNSRKTPIVIVMQRVHEEDLSGYLIDGVEEWDVLSLPALKNDGTALWPFKHTVEELLLLKNLNPSVFYFQYQQETKNIKTGGEFLEDFNTEQHIGQFRYDPDSALHISVDNNVFPYITTSIWQTIKEDGIWRIRQIKEIPSIEPFNTATKAGQQVGKYIKKIGTNQRVFIYGDPTTKQRNTIDDDKKTFLQKYVSGIRKECETEERMFRKAPGVALTGEFINAVFRGVIPNMEIEIDIGCKKSINDYIQTKKDKDGGMLKKRVTDLNGISFEEHGHFTDVMRYFIIKCFNDEYMDFINRNSDLSNIIVSDKNKFTRGGI